MIHRHKEEFVKTLERVSSQKGFLLPMIEKDYYLTLILSKLPGLSKRLVFKGGTCLNKVYYDYYRLSEDLDFSILLPDKSTTRGQRRKIIRHIKEGIDKFAEKMDMVIDDRDGRGRNESRQYVFYFVYRSAIRPIESKIKFEIGLRANPLDIVKKLKIRHLYTHPFTGKPLFDGGIVTCLSLNELVSEKLRAAATRQIIAPRDFYDLDFILRQNFILADKEVLGLFKRKLIEDGKDPDLRIYRKNLGRSGEEIANMKKHIRTELLDVLTASERDRFNLDSALSRINEAMEIIF